MARFPTVESPCPYKGDLDDIMSEGRCGLCDKVVHDLTMMSDPERRHLIESRQGDLCVRYRIFRPVVAAMAIGLTATSALAIDRPPASQHHPADKPTKPAPKRPEPLDEIVVGGIAAPPAPESKRKDSVQWTEAKPVVSDDKPR